eukprot:gene12333-25948_t
MRLLFFLAVLCSAQAFSRNTPFNLNSLLYATRVEPIVPPVDFRSAIGELINDSGAAVQDFIQDGKVSKDTVDEILLDSKVVVDEILHSPLVSDYSKFVRTLLSPKRFPVIAQIQKIFHLQDAIIVLFSVIMHKTILKLLYKITHRKSNSVEYKESFVGYMEGPANIPRLLCTLYKCFTLGSFLTKIKDWYIHRFLRRTPEFLNKRKDLVREKTVDELTSTSIWIVMTVLALEFMSLEFGIALSSVLALGGIGSASAALAFKNTAENFLSGQILRLEDKFRIGEIISVQKGEQGVVESLSLLDTSLRREDNSVVTIPNHVFTNNEVINWSRTPFRLFKTTLGLPLEQLPNLPFVVESIRQKLGDIRGVETIDRSLFVAASGFQNGQIQLYIELHFRSSNELEIARLRTETTNAIAECVATGAKKLLDN